MSASKRGAGQWRTVKYIRCFITSAGRALIADARTAVAEFKAIQTQKRRMINLRGLDNHALRDIGLIRDRFTGTVLNDASGRVPEHELRQADEVAAVPSDNLGRLLDRSMIERRQADRRTAERRRIARQKSSKTEDVRPTPAYPVQDRRAFDRRSSDHRVIDCRSLFSGRPLFLLA